MTERLTDAERRALLAGDGAEGLGPDAAAEVDLLAELLAHPATWAEPDPGLEARVVHAVEGVRTTTPTAATTPMPTAAPAPTEPVAAVGGSGGRRPTPRRASRVLAAALAAAAAILLVVGVVAVTRGTARPDFRAQLTATALAPGARATATVTHNAAGFRIAFDAHGLARLRDGAYYQAWLRNARGGLVSIGTFSSSDGGIVLWSGVNPDEYRGMTVTIEPDDDDPASSGRRVLVGVLGR